MPQAINRSLALFFSVVVLSGTVACSSSIDRAVLEEDIALPPAQGTSQGSATRLRSERIARKIANVRRSRQSTRVPMTVAVHLYGPDNNDWRWTAADRGKITSWGRELRDEGVVDGMFVMSELVSTGSSLDEIRLAAAKHGGDAVLVLKASAELDSGLNPLSVFYLTLVGYFIVPGSGADALMMANGVVLDVDSGQAFMSIAAEGEGSTFAPGGFLNENKAMDRAKSKTLGRLRSQFLEGMREVAKRLKAQAIRKQRNVRQKKFNSKGRSRTYNRRRY